MAVVFSPDRKQVLLLRREVFVLWDLPGGGIEKNEQPEHAAVRETFEETAYEIVVDKFVGRYTHQSVYGRGDQLTHAFRAHVVGGTPKRFGLEVTGLRWCDVAYLPSGVQPLQRQMIIDALADLVMPVERRIEFPLWKLYPARIIFFITRVINITLKLILRRGSIEELL